MVHIDQDDPNCNYSRMTYRSCIHIPLYVDGIYSSIDNHMLLKTHILLFRLVALENGRNPDIGTLKKDRGDVFCNVAQKSLMQNFYVMSMKYYLKLFKHT